MTRPPCGSRTQPVAERTIDLRKPSRLGRGPTHDPLSSVLVVSRLAAFAFRRIPFTLAPLAAAGCIVTQVRYLPAPNAYVDTSGSVAGPVTPGSTPCVADSYARSDHAVACEVRTFVLTPARGPLDFQSGNGGVAVEGTDTTRVATVAATVRAWAATEDAARRLLAAITVTTNGNTVRADGPRDHSFDDQGWAVDYRVTAPRRIDVSARTGNGGVRVRDVIGRLRLSSGNGAITLDSVGGAVEGRTGNGAVRATLVGRAWDGGGITGAGLDLHSGNGSALLRVPDGYSAKLSVSTGNGGLTVDFPVTLTGRIDPRRLELTLGNGGAPVTVSTGNGSARLARVE